MKIDAISSFVWYIEYMKWCWNRNTFLRQKLKHLIKCLNVKDGINCCNKIICSYDCQSYKHLISIQFDVAKILAMNNASNAVGCFPITWVYS